MEVASQSADKEDVHLSLLTAAPWLQSFLSQQYFTKCSDCGQVTHDQDLFCTVCTVGPLCSVKADIEHKDHHILKVRKLSPIGIGAAAVSTWDLKDYMDISGVWSRFTRYFDTEMVFLFPQETGQQAAPNRREVLLPLDLRRERNLSCLHCGYAFPDPIPNDKRYFCSISCKVATSEKHVHYTMEASKTQSTRTQDQSTGNVTNQDPSSSDPILPMRLAPASVWRAPGAHRPAPQRRRTPSP